MVVLDYMETTVIQRIRKWVCLTIALAMMIYAAVALPKYRQATVNPIEIEHRFTSLEENVNVIRADLAELKLTRWLELLGLSGLLGEAGLRISKKKA